jgi:2-keto-4-pentenoate hydratase/2-oxohepta-3-ene-1,7-dioic acid hydratase in catechol pathway
MDIGGQPHFGKVEGDRVVRMQGSPFDAFRLTEETFPLAGVKLLPPTVPTTFFAAGLNYRAHVHEAQSRGSPVARLPSRPETGYRANNALIGHGDCIVKPGDYSGRFEAEPELVAVIGRKIRKCTRDQAREAIFGWTIGNDVSARDWQYGDRTMWRAKNCDTFKPMGPWIVTDVDPMRSTTRVVANGKLALEFATGHMIFDPFDYIVEITRYITMFPGDVLWMGCDGTVTIAPGDTIEIEITGIGVLRNGVIGES